MVRHAWPELLGPDAERVVAATHELTGFLAATGVPDVEVTERVAWHHSCHALRELHLDEGDVDAVLGDARVPWPAGESERCCGFGGLFSATLPEVSCAMADEKLGSLPDCDVLAGADASCLLHLRSRAAAVGRPVRTAHVAELLDRGAAP